MMTQRFPQKFRVEQYSCSFWSKIEGFNILVYIPLTASKEINASRAVQRHSILPKGTPCDPEHLDVNKFHEVSKSTNIALMKIFFHS